ncbi:SpoIIE family protein phosphatase [Labilibaculum antarcticum]|nr:SpoIIE family protein phosphatase [Labilibaculum antarcticum]
MLEDLLDEKMGLVEDKMDAFFSQAEDSFFVAYDRGVLGVYKDLNVEQMNRMFTPVLDNFKLVSTVCLADKDGNNYMLMHSDDFYVNVITQQDLKSHKQLRYKWRKCGGEHSLLMKDSLEYFFDPRTRPWYIGAPILGDKTVFWTKPYRFMFTDMSGLTISKAWKDRGGEKHVLSYDVSIFDISWFTSQMEISPRGKVCILTDDNCYLGLPKDDRFKEPNDLLDYLLIKADSIDIPEMLTAKTEVLKYKTQKELYTYYFHGEKYFLEVKPFTLGDSTFKILMFIPEDDLTKDIQIFSWIVIVILSVIAVMTYGIVQANQSKRKANNLLSIQKQEIEFKNQKINDSISYAKHLQEAILPSIDQINKLLPHSFIFYRPKDVVSGDFYWKYSFDSILFYAIADCTGHGVPGAMVSVVCVNALNRAIRKHGIVEPGKILDHVRELVIDAFSQNQNEMADGMDIALCCFDFEMNKLWYAGANNSLYKVSQIKKGVEIPMKSICNADRILHDYPATRQPIGKSDRAEKFVTHEIELEKGDCIYMFSDGFSDQFGGPKGKKYMSRAFKKFLLSISDKPMEEQKVLMEKEFQEWKGELEQVDDVCVGGVKI